MTKKLPPISDADEARLQAAISGDADDAEVSDEAVAKGGRPFAEVFPTIAAAMKRSRGRPRVEQPKEKVTLRLSADVLAKLRATGRGWQSRVEETLRKDLGL